jgi:isocitrate/isopropylmalate dehydrogenase
MLTTLVDTMHAAGVDVALADVREPVTEMARRSGLLEQLGEERIFYTIDQAVQSIGATASPGTKSLAGR